MRIKAWMTAAAAAALAAASWTGPEVQAGKPGGGGTTVEGGVIYVIDDYAVSATSVSGVVKAITSAGVVSTVHAAVDVSAGHPLVLGRHLEPSRVVHGGLRWFLQERVVGAVHEVFAVAEDGTTVRLTDCAAAGVTMNIDSDGSSLSVPRWVGPDDAAISFGAFRVAGGVMSDSGIYRLAIDWTAIAEGTFTAVEPELPWLDVPPHRSDLAKLSTNFVWSPDGSRLAWVLTEVVGTPPNLTQQFSLHLAEDDGTGTGTDVSSTPLDSFWFLNDWGTSGGDDVLALRAYANAVTLNLRTGVQTTVGEQVNGDPYPAKYALNTCWSPAGGFLVFDWQAITMDRKTNGIKVTWDVHRVAASGGNALDLTRFGTQTRVLGWR